MRALERRNTRRGETMIQNIVLLAVSALLLVYLVYALLKPEKF
ncbi:K(+)-transporting ATPase subunit F [Granulicella sp. 5B5]|nr:K(+)-transporting ATPase subunit F [Granulicella sp. 5B5]